MASVELRGVSKVFADARSRQQAAAVRDVSLRIPDGQFVVLVGPSGCGKSTTLRMIAGLETPDTGAILIGDKDVTGISPRDRDVAMVFQNYALYPHMTVRKNMSFALKLRGMPRAEIDRRVEKTATMLGIGELLERRPGQLSGGQRQRVAVGRAIVREPQVFLFDEPLSNLDAKLRVATRAELKLLHQQLRTTTVYVTHDQEEAMTLGDRVVVMHQGVIMQDAAPYHVYERPASRFVASFVGTPPMNFLDGVLRSTGGAYEFVRESRTPGEAAIRLPVDPPATARLAGLEGKRVIAGVRPPALRESRRGGADIIAMQGVITLVELLGEHCDVTLAVQDQKIVSRIPTRPGLVAGERCSMTVDAPRVHLFSPDEPGENLLYPPNAKERVRAEAGAMA